MYGRQARLARASRAPCQDTRSAILREGGAVATAGFRTATKTRGAHCLGATRQIFNPLRISNAPLLSTRLPARSGYGPLLRAQSGSRTQSGLQMMRDKSSESWRRAGDSNSETPCGVVDFKTTQL